MIAKPLFDLTARTIQTAAKPVQKIENGIANESADRRKNPCRGLPVQIRRSSDPSSSFKISSVGRSIGVRSGRPLRRASFLLVLDTGFSCLPLCPGSRSLRLDPFRQLRASRLAIPLFVRLGGNLALDEELRELPPLGLALERHLDLRAHD